MPEAVFTPGGAGAGIVPRRSRVGHNYIWLCALRGPHDSGTPPSMVCLVLPRLYPESQMDGRAVLVMMRAPRDGSRLSVPPAAVEASGRRHNEGPPCRADGEGCTPRRADGRLEPPDDRRDRPARGGEQGDDHHWRDGKADLIVEAYLAKAARDAPVPEIGSVRQDLVELLGRLAFAFTRLGSGRTMTDFVVESHSNSSFGDLFRSTLLASRHRAMEEVLERGQRRGEIRQGVQMTIIIDALYGAMYHRLLMSRETIDAEFVRGLVGTVIDGVAAR